MYEYGEFSGVNSLEYHPNVSQKNTKIIEIETRTLDEYCLEKKIDNIYFVKIDVEGHEINTLKGAAKMIHEKKIKMIQFEYNYLWKNTENKLEDAFLLLKDNYDLYRLTPWGKIRISQFKKKLENFPHASNYIAVSKSN